MTPEQVKRLQRGVGVADDGILGRGTLGALLRHMGAPTDISNELALAGVVHMASAKVFDTPLRLAHFIAQLAHESDGFRAMEEYASGAAYEGRKNLGNTQPGDGKRYKGRGPIQVTGRANYRRYGQIIGVDLERRPELASAPSIGLAVSCAYWTDRNINEAADRDDIERVTRIINGGLNGLADRRAKLAKVEKLMGLAK